MSTPATRWEQGDHSHYADRFTRLIAAGEDIDGEARLVDVLAPRGARVLDAGSGMGRVGAALAGRGHDVTCVEKDAELVAAARTSYPDLPVVTADLLDLTPELLARAGRPTSYDVVVAVGNVMVYVAEDTEEQVLRSLAALLAPGGRVLVGFKTAHGPRNAAAYPEAAFRTDVEAVGLVVEHRFGGYDLRETDPDYAVFVLGRPPA
ncbi:class I SAM-dependent methyltransferase [Marmoricola endophyticus]|uniref:class I SAM-dependent methyltransferase n=1 Tax=Marmoricola endophyticus TaxID=2040280 RepID=UPI00166ABFD2|nr:class I SAM-dependent methyltransferase [Marmoricola endophyticus]